MTIEGTKEDRRTEAYYLVSGRHPVYRRKQTPKSECGVMTQDDVCTYGLRPQA